MNLPLTVSSLILVTLTCLFTCRTVPPGTASPGPEQRGDWRLYTPPDKSFSVELPCDPARRNVSATPTPIYEYGCERAEASGLTFFSVSVLNMLDAERARMRDESAFEGSVRDSFTPNHRLVRLTLLKIEGGFGREVVSINTEDEMDNLRGRVIIFGGRRYEVGYLATDVKALESRTAERFLASFKPLR